MNLSSESIELFEGMTLLQRYTIIDRVAGGGMATIYRANDDRLDRVVCVKLLRLLLEGSGSTSGGAVYEATYSHFLKEALALSKLSHPNTLRIYDFGYLDDAMQTHVREGEGDKRGRPFQISEFLDGGNLEQFVRMRGALKPQEALAILERMAGAVAEAHQHDIIHRDIKPSNILFSRVGALLMPKLADFGIARCNLQKRSRSPSADEDAQDTLEIVSTVPLFSPRWAAPEQLTEREEGPPTDVYALGLVMTFMLAGKAPFEVDDVRSTFTERVRADDYVTARLQALGLGSEVRQVLLESMRADPRQRFQTPQAFHDALSDALGGQRSSMPPPIVPPRPSFESVTIEAVTASRSEHAARSVVPPEQWLDVGDRRVRLVEVHDSLDLALSTGEDVGVRFRITLLPARGAPFRLHLKGLNCFVSKPGNSSSPAMVSDGDGRGEFISMSRERIGEIAWSFGVLSEASRNFPIGGAQLVVPLPQGLYALAIELGGSREVIVICRRP